MSELDELRGKVMKLPQERLSWLVVVRRLRSWLNEGDEILRPWLMLCLSRSVGVMIGTEVILAPPTPEEALHTLFQFMLEPMPGSLQSPCRPAKITFEDRALALAVRQDLNALGIRASFGNAPRDVDFMIGSIEEAMREEEGEEIGGLLEAEGVTPKRAEAFFAAAADFYRAEPWIRLGNTQTLAISFPPADQTWYVTVMGQGGMEYGLILHSTWEQVERLFHELDDPIGGIPSEGMHSLSFEPPYQLPFADLDAIETYDWEVAGEVAYPLPAIFDLEQVLRPPDAELELWERVMRAVVAFTSGHLQPNGMGDYLPVEAEMTVATGKGEVAARVRYPAGERDLGNQAYRAFWGEKDDGDSVPIPDRRGLEGALLDLTGGYEDPDLEAAQRVMYRAWDAKSRKERIRLAERALARSPNCADAYVLLAEERAKTVREALGYYQKGVEAGEAALGAEPFEEDVGYFWGLLDTRPYMRARYGLANCLWELDRLEEAEAHYRELLRLNLGDNQGVRYTLLRLLMDSERYDDALQLTEEHKDDASAEMMFNRAMILFRLRGPGEAAEAAMEEALEWNPHIPPYLLGSKRVPSDRPSGIQLGGESEATEYAASYLNHWRITPGALDWLRSLLADEGS